MHTAPAAFPTRSHPAALATVVLLHAGLAYALVHWLGMRVIDSLPRVIDARIVSEQPKEPPPPLPQPTKGARYQPTLSQMPMPDLPTQQPQEPTITTSPELAPMQPTELAPRTGEQGAVARVSLSRAPTLLVSSCDKPEYPAAAARAEVEGTTRIAFTVDASGRVASAQVLRSAGPSREHKLLDRKAVETLSRCPFTPGRDEAGQPVGGSAVVDYGWTLK
jgi:protein TonB